MVSRVIYSAASLRARHPLKAYDAVQLAAGLALQGTLTARHIRLSFVSRDDALLTAARAEGLSVDNPLWHTDVNL